MASNKLEIHWTPMPLREMKKHLTESLKLSQCEVVNLKKVGKVETLKRGRKSQLYSFSLKCKKQK